MGFTKQTNELLHLKSKMINQRYRDPHISKDLDRKTWANLSQYNNANDNSAFD